MQDSIVLKRNQIISKKRDIHSKVLHGQELCKLELNKFNKSDQVN